MKTAFLQEGPAWGSCRAAEALGRCTLEPRWDEPVCVRLVEELCAEHEDQPHQASVKAREGALKTWLSCVKDAK